MWKLDNKEILNSLEQIISKEEIKQNEPMKNHTSFKIGGPAEFYIKIKSVEELRKILEFAKNENIKVLGNAAGSGAIQILLHKDKYNNMNEVIQNTRHVELANHKDFNRIFADSLML